MQHCQQHKRDYHTMCPDCYANPIAMPNTTLADYIKSYDTVNKPKHYAGKVECIDAIESAVEGLEGIEAVCTANAIKYLYRWKKKNGVEDIKKAKWYIERLLNGLNAS